MKRLIVCSCIIVASLTIALASLFHLNKTTSEISNELVQIKNLHSDGKTEESVKLAEETFNKWENKSKLVHIYIDDNQIIPITSSLAEVKLLLATDTPEVYAECDSIIEMLKAMKEMQIPCIHNIL